MKLCLQKNADITSCEDIEIDYGYIAMHGMNGTYPCVRFIRTSNNPTTKFEEIKLSDYFMVHIL